MEPSERWQLTVRRMYSCSETLLALRCSTKTTRVFACKEDREYTVPTSLAQRDTVAVSTAALDPKVASTACSEVPFQGLISSHNVNIVSGIPELTIAERGGEI